MPLHETVDQSSQLRCSALLYSPEIQLPSDFSCAHLIDDLHRCPSYCWSHLLLLIILVTILCESCHATLPSRLKAPCDVSTSYFYWEASWLFHDSCPKNLQWSLFTAEWRAALNSLLKDLNFQLLFFLECDRKCSGLLWRMYMKRYVSMNIVFFTQQWPILSDISLAILALWMHALLCTAVSLHGILAVTMDVLVVVRCSNNIRYLSSRNGWVSLLL